MRLRLFVVSVVAGAGSAGTVFGQTAVVPQAGVDSRSLASTEARAKDAAAANPQHRRQFGRDSDAPPADGPSLLRENGNSLLRASLAARSDPNQAQMRDVSFTYVPTPEPKVVKKHDLVTIIVREESQFSSAGNTDSKRESTIDAALEDFIKLNVANFAIEGGGIGPLQPAVKAHANREFKGTGTVDRTDSFSARITAEVVDVKPNGTLVLQARKRIKTDEEEQSFVLTGICRATDITADNSVLSTQLYDSELSKSHKGAVRNATRKGWGGKLLDFVLPF